MAFSSSLEVKSDCTCTSCTSKMCDHHNGIFEALTNGTHYVIWPTPEGEPNDKLLVKFFLRSHKVR